MVKEASKAEREQEHVSTRQYETELASHSHDVVGRERNVGILSDDYGVLAAAARGASRQPQVSRNIDRIHSQLKYDRLDVLGSHLADDPAYARRAREVDLAYELVGDHGLDDLRCILGRYVDDVQDARVLVESGIEEHCKEGASACVGSGASKRQGDSRCMTTM